MGGKHLQDNTNCDCKQKFLYLHPSLSLSPPFSLPASEGDRERPENMANPKSPVVLAHFLKCTSSLILTREHTATQHTHTYLGWSTGLNIIILYCYTHIPVPAENVNVQQFVYFLLLQLTYKNVHTQNTCIRTRATLASVSTKKSLTTNRIERRTPLIRAKVLKSAEGLRLPATKVDGTKIQKRMSCLIE